MRCGRQHSQSQTCFSVYCKGGQHSHSHFKVRRTITSYSPVHCVPLNRRLNSSLKELEEPVHRSYLSVKSITFISSNAIH